MDDDILKVEHVSNEYSDNGLGIFAKRGKKKVLQDVSFSIHKDEFFGLVGESGCGKSTLAGAVLGLIPFEGSIKIDGTESSALTRKDRARKVQAVFQDPMSALNPRKTIGFTLREPLRAHGIGTKEEQTAAVNRMLEMVGLDASYASRYPRELSGGQRQRVCIGAALMLQPELVIADEAISALDVSVGAQILNLFREIDRKAEFAMLFISHNLNVEYYLCDRIAVMYRGCIVELSTAEEIYHNPQHPYTKLLLSAIPQMDVDMWENEQEEELEVPKDAPDGACCFYHRCPKACERCLAQPQLKNVEKSKTDQTQNADAVEHLAACALL